MVSAAIIMNNTLKQLAASSKNICSGEAAETKRRLEKCWSVQVDWGLYPVKLKEVRVRCIYDNIIMHVSLAIQLHAWIAV